MRAITHQSAEVASAALLVSASAKHDDYSERSMVIRWHLFSLDAPTVAVLWTVFTAVITHTKLPFATPLTMGLTVWILYASDRLLDSRHLDAAHQTNASIDLAPRHLFHHRYHTAFVIAITVCTVALVALIPLLSPAALRLYLTEGVLMAGYFLLVHAAPKSSANPRLSLFLPSRIPKELIVGPFFAAAIFIPTISRKPELRLELLPLAILLAGLCCLNCLYIYAWEHPTDYRSHWTTAYAIRNLNRLTWLFLIASAFCFLSLGRLSRSSYSVQLYPLACGISALSLSAIHQLRGHFSSLTLRSIADATLLTPLGILPFILRHPA